MVYDWSLDGSERYPDGPYTIVDGAGNLCQLPVYWADTETGLVKYFPYKSDLHMTGEWDDFGEGLVRRETRLVPPLRVLGHSEMKGFLNGRGT